MQIQIPNKEGKVFQTNEGETAGNIWASWNMDFISNPGKIRVSPQGQVVLTNLTSTATTYDAQLSLPTAFVMSDADSTMKIWACTIGAMFKNATEVANTSALTGWVQDAGTGSPTTIDGFSDMAEFNGGLIVSLPTSLTRLFGSTTWTANWNSVSLTTNKPHPLCVAFNNLLLIGNGNKVVSVNVLNAINTGAVILGTEYEVLWIRSSNQMIYIGARNKKSGRAKVFAWDGSSQNFNFDYKINGQYSLSGVIKKEVCYTVNECGELLVFTGGGFTQIAKFPNWNINVDLGINSANDSYSYWKNCLAVQNDNIYILLNNDLGTISNVLENMPSGVWCYNDKVGLHHAYSLSTQLGDSVSTDYGNSRISNGGAIYPLSRTAGLFLIGSGLYYNSASSAAYYMQVIRELETETTAKIGYFITPKIQTAEVEENWQKVFLIIKKLINATDKIVVKYRITDKIIVDEPAICVWTSTTTLTTTDTQFANASAGDEMEILNGEGAGLSTHITTITYSNPTYTITIEDTVPYASGSVRAVVWNWTKLGTINTQNQGTFELGLGVNSSWIQYKVVCFFSGKNEINKFISTSIPQLKAI